MIKTPTFGEKPTWVLQPLNLATVAGQIPPDVEVEAVDDRIEEIDYDTPRDLVGLSLKTFTARRAYQIAAEFRKRGVPVLLGGHHPTLLPDEAGQYADSIVRGEIEGLWPQILDDLAHHHLQPVYHRTENSPPVHIQSNRAVLAGKKYLPVTLIETARGCPFNCTFCSVSAFFGKERRHRPVAEVIEELTQNPQPLTIFIDDNIVADREKTRELCEALRPLHLHWGAQASLNLARDPEMLKLMKKSGCSVLIIGIESIRPENLDQIKKRWNDAGPGISESLKIIRDHGIAVLGSFLLGMDGDTPETLRTMLDFAMEQKFFAGLFNILQPYPGTEFYATVEKEGRLNYPQWWNDPTYRYGMPAFTPKNMSPEKLMEMHAEMFESFYNNRSVAQRLINWTNVGDLWRAATYLAINVPARKEEAFRTNQPLGSVNL